GRDGRRAEQRGHRRPPGDHRAGGGEAHPVHLHQARPRPGRPRPPPGPGRAGVPARHRRAGLRPAPAGGPGAGPRKRQGRSDPNPGKEAEMTFTARGLYASSSKEPRRRRFRWLWVGAVVALVALLFGAVGALGAVPVGKEGETIGFENPEGLVVENRTGGSVTVTESGVGMLEVDSKLWHTLLNKAESTVDRDGDGVVRAEAGCNGAFGAACSVEYEITVPAGTEVTVETSSGEVELAGL